MSLISAAVLLFLVLDPLGNIPLFLSILKNIDPKKHKKIIIRELLIGLFTLVIFLFAGRYILYLLHVSQQSLSIAGGIILFLIALKMIFSDSDDIFKSHYEGEPFIVPLAIPLIAGPSAISTILLLMWQEPSRWLVWFISLICAWIVSVIILLFSNNLSRIFGNKGLTALERLMGMLLTTVAVEMFITGIKQSFLK